jgi:hypothetical protein
MKEKEKKTKKKNKKKKKICESGEKKRIVKKGQNEPTPTNAPMWMEGALMDVPFFVIPCPKTNQGGKCRLIFFSFPQPKLILFLGTFFFLTPHIPPSYLHLNYMFMHLGFLPPPPTYLPTHLPTYL